MSPPGLNSAVFTERKIFKYRKRKLDGITETLNSTLGKKNHKTLTKLKLNKLQTQLFIINGVCKYPC